MKTLATCALALLLTVPVLAKDGKDGISISFDSEDSRTELGPRHCTCDAKTAITTRDKSATLLVLDDVVAMQLTDATLNRLESKEKAKENNFLEDLVVAGVRLAVGKSLEYPIANIKSIDYADGALRLIGGDGKPVFTNVKVNGTDVLRDFSRADVARFANAVRAAKARR